MLDQEECRHDWLPVGDAAGGKTVYRCFVCGVAKVERLCAECHINPVPKGRRIFCSERCYRKSNRRTSGQQARERQRRRRALTDQIVEAVKEIQKIDPHYGHWPVRTIRVTWGFGWPDRGGPFRDFPTWRGETYYVDEIEKSLE